MLPIVKRKTLEIPHGLAAIAAAVCLGLAFASDFQAREQALKAELDRPAPVEIMVNVPEELGADRVNGAESARTNRVERNEGRLSFSLLPWLPKLRSGGG